MDDRVTLTVEMTAEELVARYEMALQAIVVTSGDEKSVLVAKRALDILVTLMPAHDTDAGAV